MTNYAKIFDSAIENYGLITTEQARNIGITPGTLVDLAFRGRLTHIGYGVYQLVQYLPSPNDPYAQAVALVGKKAFLYGESVIALLGIAATNPDRIHVATPDRVRRNLGNGVVIYKVDENVRRTIIEGIPAQPVVDAIVSAQKTMPTERLVEATDNALRIGKISEDEKDRIIHEIK